MGLKLNPKGTLLYDMGLEEGKKEGIKEGIRRTILVGLKARFGAQAIEQAHVSDLLAQIDSEAVLERIGEKVHTVSSFAEFLTYLKTQI